MGLVREPSNNLNRAVECTFKVACPLAQKVPDFRSREMAVVDSVQFYFCGRMGKAKFLVQSAVFINVSGNLLLDILLAAIYFVGN